MVWTYSARVKMMSKVKIIRNGAARAIDNGPTRKATY